VVEVSMAGPAGSVQPRRNGTRDHAGAGAAHASRPSDAVAQQRPAWGPPGDQPFAM